MINMTNLTSASFSVAEAQSTIKPLVIMIIGVVIYAVFIFKFYRFLARKDVFKLNLNRYSKSFFGFIGKIFRMLFYILEYLIIFPLFIFFWFGFISVAIILLSDKLDVSQILVVAMALVASIRVTAYYNEDLSKDLAKMFPFTVLAVFLLGTTAFSYDIFITNLKIIPSLWKQMLYYLAFTILLEFILRIAHGIFKSRKPAEEKEG